MTITRVVVGDIGLSPVDVRYSPKSGCRDNGKSVSNFLDPDFATVFQRNTSGPCPLYPRKRTLADDSWMSALCQKQTFRSPRAPKENVGSPQRCSGGLFTMSDEDFVDHVEHANSKLLLHWCEPWRGLQSGLGVGEPLLPSRLHVRAAELEIL
jgi:hypothetical protein